MLAFLREVYKKCGHSQEQNRLSWPEACKGGRQEAKGKKQLEVEGFEGGGCWLTLQSL